MKLNEILYILGIKSDNRSIVNSVVIDNKKAKKDTLFVALKGKNVDGYELIDDKLLNNVAAVFTYKDHPHEKVFKIENLKLKINQIVSLIYPNHYSHIKFIGIAGTCGKSTTAKMIYYALNKLNIKTAYFGTGEVVYKDVIIPTNNTTLDTLTFYETLDKLPYEEIEYIVMEVSSIAVVENRVSHLSFNYLIFTNFSQDHLDIHHNLASYFEAKKYLFTLQSCNDTAIINIDDKKSYEILAVCKSKIITYGIRNGLYNTKDYLNNKVYRFNNYNFLAAYSLLKCLKISSKRIKSIFDEYIFNDGRCQLVYEREYKIILDYAHTPSSFKNILKDAKSKLINRLIVVFGCGGNRDSKKRKIIGQIVEKYADLIIITNDNPRYENEDSIIADIGIKNAMIIKNRKTAISFAIKEATPNDCILILGKGKEDYQEIKGKKIKFNDLSVIKECLRQNE